VLEHHAILWRRDFSTEKYSLLCGDKSLSFV